MLTLLILPLLFINCGLINAGEINVLNIYDVVDSVVRDVLHGELTVGGDFGNMDKKSWTKLLRVLVPDLHGVNKGLGDVAKAMSVFIDALVEQNKTTNSKNIFVPIGLISETKKAIDDTNTALHNIMTSNLTITIANNENILKAKNGNIIIPSALAHQIKDILEYISNQFSQLEKASLSLENVLKLLSKALKTNDKNSSFGTYLFKRFAEGIRQAAILYGLVARDFTDLVQQYYNLAEKQNNGDILLRTSQLTATTDNAAQRIAENMDKIAAAMQRLLNQISQSASY